MEQIEGFSLDGLLESPLTTDRWEDVLQRTVDAVKEINIRDVVVGDCRPGDVIVQTNTGIPIILDFAQAATWDSKENENFIQVVRQNNNPKYVVSWLASRVEREEGIELRIVYPGLDQVFNLKTGEAKREERKGR